MSDKDDLMRRAQTEIELADAQLDYHRENVADLRVQLECAEAEIERLRAVKVKHCERSVELAKQLVKVEAVIESARRVSDNRGRLTEDLNPGHTALARALNAYDSEDE